MLYEFKCKSNVNVATENIRGTYAENALSVPLCYLWLTRFRSVDYSLEDLQKSGLAVELDNDIIQLLIESDLRQK